MSSTNGTRKGLRAVTITAALLALSAVQAVAAPLAAGPLRILDNNNYSCAVVNTSSKAIAVKVSVTIDGGGYGAEQDCPSLAPNAVCVATNDAGFAGYRSCTITTSAKRNSHATFCNNSTGICVPAQ